jgi:ATP-dependent Zn protease
MSRNENTDGGENGAGASKKPRRPARAWVIWAAIFCGIILMMLFKDRMEAPGDILNQYQFEQLVDSSRIVRATINYNPQNSALNEIVGKYRKQENDRTFEVPFRATVRLTRDLEARLLSLPQFEPHEPNTMVFSFVASVLPIIVIAALIWFFFIRRIKAVARSSAGTAQVVLTTTEQQARFDRILDKWEEQARRMDGVLGKMERDNEGKT